MVSLLLGDCLVHLKDMESNSIDSIITDPPYGISFMAKKWDYDIPSVEIWKECLRVLKPGGHLLSFGGSRTFHRIAVSIEDAGFDIRDTIMWVYGSGFPKSHNIGKAIDKKLGNKREVIGENPNHRTSDALYELGFQGGKSNGVMTKGTSEYEGWGTALKPAFEPIIMARKPFRGDVASNVLEYGTGGINIDGCRVECNDKTKFPVGDYSTDTTVGKIRNSNRTEDTYKNGRWPANFIHDGSDEVLELFPNTGGGTYRFNPTRNRGNTPFFEEKDIDCSPRNAPDSYGDSGSAARYFYCAKASKKDRNEGVNVWDLEDLKLELMDINQLIKDISEDYLMEKCEWNTIMSMNNIMDQSQKDMIFIISMVSKLIIDLKTYNVSQNLNIKEYIQDVSNQMKENGLNLVENVEQIKMLKQNTIDEKMVLVLGVSLVVLKMLLKIKIVEKGNIHPTLKPTELMRYLCRLVTPKNGTILDPFMGSGSTGKAALLEDFSFIGIEMDEDYFEIAKRRVNDGL